jgi:cell division protein FtsL
MISRSNILLLVIFALCITGLFQIKYRVMELKRETKEITNKLNSEKRELGALKAEWAYLNNPERIASLAVKYLNLSKTTADRLGENHNKKVKYLEKDERKTKIMNIAYKKSAGKWRYRKDQQSVTKSSSATKAK